jgi:hypothetical protein
MATEITEREARQVAEEALFDNDDTDAYALAQGVLGGRFEWLEEGIVDPAGP